MQPHSGSYLRRSIESQGVLSAPYVSIEDFLINFICSSFLPIYQVKLQRMVSAIAGLGWELGLSNWILLRWGRAGFVHKIIEN